MCTPITHLGARHVSVRQRPAVCAHAEPRASVEHLEAPTHVR